VIQKKVNSALTDSVEGITYDPISRPGLSNLLQILFYLDGRGGTVSELADDMANVSKRAVKDRVVQTIDRHLAPIRAKYEGAMHAQGGRLLDDVAKDGASKATASANATMTLVREAVGF
jgi:tryptophanyl-tRNA synthetase